MAFIRLSLFASIICTQFIAEAKFHATELVVFRGNKYDALNGMWCPIWKNNICGNDGITYWNDCLFTAARRVKKDLYVQNYGICEYLDCLDCDLRDHGTVLEICASNAQIFKNKCTFECHQDYYPQLIQIHNHCRRGFPTLEEFQNSSSEVYYELFYTYHKKYLDIVRNYNGYVYTRRYLLKVVVDGEEVNVRLGKIVMGDFATVQGFDRVYFYAYNDLYGYTKFIFSFDKLTFDIRSFRVLDCQNRRYKGSAKITVGWNQFEMVVDASSSPAEEYCPIIRAKSFKLVDMGNLTVDVKANPRPTLNMDHLTGLLQDLIMDYVNSFMTPTIVRELQEIPCLTRPPGTSRLCFSFFQSRMCF